MAFFTSYNFKLNGPAGAAAVCDKLVLVKNPLKTDNFAQFMAKVIASANITGADFTMAAVGDTLRMTVAAKAGVDPSGVAAVGDDLCHALVDTEGSEVYVVVDCNNRVITNETNDTVTIPSMVYNIDEPVAA
jgi:hypothetical protein